MERFNASSISHRALVSFARTLFLHSWRSIKDRVFLSGGRKSSKLFHDSSTLHLQSSMRPITAATTP
jgi:hypothetical protein